MANLLDYLPDELKEYYELAQTLLAADPQIKELDDLLLKWDNNLFIKSADVDGIRKYEEFLDITPLPDDTLEDRRFRILTIVNQRLPYTWIQLHRMMAAICGEDGYKMALMDLILTVKLAMDNGKHIKAIYEMLLKVVPMNILIKISQLLESKGLVHVGAATFTGTKLVLYPMQMDDLNSNEDLYSGILLENGTSIIVYPQQEDKITTNENLYNGIVLRNGTSLTVYPTQLEELTSLFNNTIGCCMKYGTSMQIFPR